MALNYLLIVLIIIAIVYVAYRVWHNIDTEDEIIEEIDSGEIDLKFLIRETAQAFSRTLKKNINDDNMTQAEMIRKERRRTSLRQAILLAGIVIIFVVCMAIFVSQLVKIIKHRKDDTVTKRKVSKKTNNLMWIYNLYKNTPFLKRYFVKVRSKVSLLYPADGYSINLMTSRVLAKGTFGGLIAVALTLILSQGSVFYLCAGLLISYVVITEIVTNSVNNLEFTIMEQLQDAIQKVRHHYHECKNVDQAIWIMEN